MLSTAVVATENATNYLRQLCRHWSHRWQVEFTNEHGTIQLPAAVCTLDASPTELKVQVDVADAEQQNRMEGVVAEHLQRFGFREVLVFHWQRA